MPLYGRASLPDWTTGTATVAANATAVTLTGGGLLTVDAVTGANLYGAGRGDLFVVPGVGAKFIQSVNSATSITLVEPWTYGAQTAVTYAIIRYSLPATGNVAKAVSDLYSQGADINPDVSRTIDDGTGRMKLKLANSDTLLAVGTTGVIDASLKPALGIDTATGQVSFPGGATTPMEWDNNRIINGGFDIWQRGTTSTVALNTAAYTADQWRVLAPVGVACNVSQVAGLSSPFAINMQSSAVPLVQFLALSQRFEAAAVADLAGQPVTLSFDMITSASAGTITGLVQPLINTYKDSGTFNQPASSNPSFTPLASGRVSVAFTPAQTANWAAGLELRIRFAKAAAAGDMNITVGAVTLEKGITTNTSWSPKPLVRELLACQRYMQVSWPMGYTQANAPYPFSVYSPSVAVANAGTFATGIIFDPPMRVSPTMSIYDTAGTLAKATFAGVAGKTATLTACSAFAAYMTNSSGAALAAGSPVQFHWVADARL